MDCGGWDPGRIACRSWTGGWSSEGPATTAAWIDGSGSAESIQSRIAARFPASIGQLCFPSCFLYFNCWLVRIESKVIELALDADGENEAKSICETKARGREREKGDKNGLACRPRTAHFVRKSRYLYISSSPNAATTTPNSNSINAYCFIFVFMWSPLLSSFFLFSALTKKEKIRCRHQHSSLTVSSLGVRIEKLKQGTEHWKWLPVCAIMDWILVDSVRDGTAFYYLLVLLLLLLYIPISNLVNHKHTFDWSGDNFQKAFNAFLLY